MKKIQRIAALSLAGLLTCAALPACVVPGSQDLHKDKTHLNIKVFNGGFGFKWLQEVANNFMETFKDVSFEEGKKGVHIAITANKEFSGLHSNMAVGADAEDVYYTSDCNFWNFYDAGVAYDVTDIMTANVYDEDGFVTLNAEGNGWETQSKSIADRITSEHIAKRINIGTADEPEYCSLPFDDTTAGIIVDWDLFKKEGWNNYNGLDGMPATISEFYDLLGRIRKKGYSAFIFSTGVQYTRVINYAVIAQVDGTEWYNDLYSDYTGSYDFNGDGMISEAEQITPSTAYKLYDTKGSKAAVEMALKMFEKNASGKTFYDPATATGVAFGVAQQDFIMSKETSQPIAMLLDGEWWENEARATFDAMGEVSEENAYGAREFRMMPIPAFTSTNANQRYTLGAWTGGSSTIVNQKTVGDNAAKQKVVELWLQYQYSAEGLKCFTRHSGATMPLQYEMSDAELQELTPFARNLFKLRRDPRVEVIYSGVSLQNEQVRKSSRQVSFITTLDANYTGTLFSIVLKLSTKNKMVSLEKYVEGMHKYQDQMFRDAYPDD